MTVDVVCLELTDSLETAVGRDDFLPLDVDVVFVFEREAGEEIVVKAEIKTELEVGCFSREEVDLNTFFPTLDLD